MSLLSSYLNVLSIFSLNANLIVKGKRIKIDFLYFFWVGLFLNLFKKQQTFQSNTKKKSASTFQCFFQKKKTSS